MIARQLGCHARTVRRWRARFAAHSSAESLVDRARSGRPPLIPVPVRCEVIKLACSRPQESSTAQFHEIWTLKSLQDALEASMDWRLSRSEIARILRAEQIRPHRWRVWLHSPDPEFQVKVQRICQLYEKPPEDTTVLCIDEKSGMQALERKHPNRWPAQGRCGRREFEYTRHGTRTLIAAFDIRTGRVFGQCRPRRTAEDLLAFMDAVAAHYPGEVYVVWDNLNIHHGPRWEQFNSRHDERFHFLYTPLHASWVNQIEIWFAILARRILRYGSFCSIRQLEARVMGFIDHWNTHEAHPFTWTFRGRWKSRMHQRAA